MTTKVKKDLTIFSKSDFVSSTYSLNLENQYKCRVLLQQVQSKDNKGLLFDIDLYKDTKNLEPSTLKIDFANIEKILNGEVTVFINEVLAKITKNVL